MVVFRMCRTFFVLLKCTIQGGPKVDVFLIAFLHLWLKFWDGIDKYCIVPVRKLFYVHHCTRPVTRVEAPTQKCVGQYKKCGPLSENSSPPLVLHPRIWA